MGTETMGTVAGGWCLLGRRRPGHTHSVVEIVSLLVAKDGPVHASNAKYILNNNSKVKIKHQIRTEVLEGINVYRSAAALI